MPRPDTDAIDTMIREGTGLPEALKDRSSQDRIMRRIVALLNSRDAKTKWRAVAAAGLAAERIPPERMDAYLGRLLWAMNDESGAVPFGVPEALGEIAAARPELKPRIVPILVSCVVNEDMAQAGPILAGAIWAIGRAGIEDEGEKERLRPGLEAALRNDDPEVRAMAVSTAERLGVAVGEAGKE